MCGKGQFCGTILVFFVGLCSASGLVFADYPSELEQNAHFQKSLKHGVVNSDQIQVIDQILDVIGSIRENDSVGSTYRQLIEDELLFANSKLGTTYALTYIEEGVPHWMEINSKGIPTSVDLTISSSHAKKILEFAQTLVHEWKHTQQSYAFSVKHCLARDSELEDQAYYLERDFVLAAQKQGPWVDLDIDWQAQLDAIEANRAAAAKEATRPLTPIGLQRVCY